MGWSYGHDRSGREIGYGVAAECDRPGCNTKIDRGLGFCCGGMHDAGFGVGCGGYFCGEHLVYTGVEDDETGLDQSPGVALCIDCALAWEHEATLICEDEECGHLGVKHDRRADPYKSDKPLPACNVSGCSCEYWQPPS